MIIEEIKGLPEPAGRIHRAGLWLTHAKVAAHWGAKSGAAPSEQWRRWKVADYAQGVFDALCAMAEVEDV